MWATIRGAVLASTTRRLSTALNVQSSKYSTGGATPLVIVEHSNQKITTGTLAAVTAAKALGPVTLLVTASEGQEVAQEAAKIEGVSKVLLAKSPLFKTPLAESFSNFLVKTQKKHNFSHLLFPASNFGKNIAPRTAALLDVSPLTDVISILSDSKFKRPIYAGNAIATVSSKDPVKILSVRTTAFDKAATNSSNTAPVEEIEVEDDAQKLSSFESVELTKSERPDLSAARIVVSGGRALKSKENFDKIVEDLADSFGAAIGASRAAVDAGYAPNDYQVGQTGKIVAPELYIALGISGAIQHLAGMKDSKIIVSINKDAESPIFQVSDYGLVADLFTAAPEFARLVKSSK